jgi:hypothetical protein
VDDRFLIAFYHLHVPEQIAAWLNARDIKTTMTRVITDTPKEEGFHGSYVAAVRVEWDCPAEEVRHADALRRHIAEINPDAVSHAADFGFNPIEYELWGMAGTADRALGPAFTIRTGPEE